MPQIKPSVPQFDYITCDDPYPAMVSGFGAGKTQAAVNRSIIGKLKYPTLNRGFYEPTYDLVRMIAFPRFEEVLTELGIPYKLYKSPLNYIEIENHGKIFFRSMDTPSRIIGYEHADADVDELDTLKKDDAAEVWRRILSRNRQKKPDGKPNTIGVTTTPEGFRFVYDNWKKDPKNGYRIIQASTDSNPHLPDGYIQSLIDIYPSNLLEAYIDGRFVNLTSGSVYPSFNRESVDCNETYQDKDVLHIGMDFNVNKMSACIFVQRGDFWAEIDEIKDGRDTPQMIEIIKQRYPESRIIIYPDASGKNASSKGASLSDISLLRAAGFEIRAKDSNPPVKDRVAAVNKALEDGKVRINVRKCPTSADHLEQQAYDANGQPDKKSGLDHMPDAFGYFVYYNMPIIKPFIIPEVRRFT